MTVPTVLQVIYYAFVAASVAYQYKQQRKMQQAARDAADARKGFEMVVEGEVFDLPTIYGRAKVGGGRVWHNTASSYNFGGDPIAGGWANKYWDLGGVNQSIATTGSGNSLINIITFIVYDRFGIGSPVLRPVANNGAGALGVSQTGEKNQYLFFQQAFCHGPIHACYDVAIDDSRDMRDPQLTLGKAAFRTEVSYNGLIANNTIIANFGDRAKAKFPGIAYASTIVRLNRDEPQFNNVPLLQYFIEGRLIRKIIRSGSAGNYTYTLSGTREYSNNPAWCLLDYLIKSDDLTYLVNGQIRQLFSPGKELSITEINLESFYNAAIICDRTVAFNVTTGGKIWRTTDWNGVSGSRYTPTRNIPLFECNVILDPKKTIRDNIETILATMGDARLLWSEGKYKLNLKYPQVGAGISNPGPDYPPPRP